jgi:asparagine synthase (glutamine-hydrolysing)
MAHGVECRAPFMDYRLVVYLFSLPSEIKLGNMFNKRILRDAMTGLLPETVRLRSDKKGFQPSDKWLGDSLEEFILDHMSSSEFLQSDIYDGVAVRKAYLDKTINPKLCFRYLQIMFLIQSFRHSAVRMNE